jgi:hypothetical protein
LFLRYKKAFLAAPVVESEKVRPGRNLQA